MDTINRDNVLDALDGSRWRVWSKIAQEITGRKATIEDVRTVRDITEELVREGRVVRGGRYNLQFRSSRHEHVEAI